MEVKEEMKEQVKGGQSQFGKQLWIVAVIWRARKRARRRLRDACLVYCLHDAEDGSSERDERGSRRSREKARNI
jgi:hypothetical protein